MNWIDVTQPPFGAAGDGFTDDAAAIDGAIGLLHSQGGGGLYFPRGRYFTTKRHRVAGASCRLTGDGTDLSQIIWDTRNGGAGDGGGFAFEGGAHKPNNSVNTLEVDHIALVTRETPGGTAIHVSWANTASIRKLNIHDVELKGEGLYADAS